MKKERSILRAEKARYKEKLATLKHYIRELKDRCADCGTTQENVGEDLMRAENDVQYYENQVKDINSRVKALAAKTSQSPGG